MTGVLFSLLAGILISLQGVFNTRVSDKIGLWETSTLVHGVGFLFALVLLMLFGNGNIRKLGEVNKLYLLGGMFGAIIVFSVMNGITMLGAAYSVAITLIIQLVVSTIIDTYGLFGSPRVPFDFTKALGLIIIVVGIVIYKIKG